MGETYIRGEKIYITLGHRRSSKERWILLFCFSFKMAALFLKNKRGLLELPMTTDQTIDELVQLSDIQGVSLYTRSYVTLSLFHLLYYTIRNKDPYQNIYS